MSYDLKVLEQGCEELGIALNDTQKQQFIAFYEYLAEKNKVMNLTGITEFQEVLVKHFLDSLACVKAVDMTKVRKLWISEQEPDFREFRLRLRFRIWKPVFLTH